MTDKSQAISDNITISENISKNISKTVSDNILITDKVVSKTQSPISNVPSLVKAVIQTYASDGSISSRKFVNTLISAEINKDGDRAVDTATFVFPSQTSIAQNNGILYIQDIVDTRFLSGIWNFHYSLVDESGNDLDGTSANESESKYDPSVTPLLGRNNYSPTTFTARRISANGDQITISNSSNVIDLSKQFDILIHFSCLTNADSNTNPKYIFDTQHGGGTGLSIFLDSSGIINVQKNGGSSLLTGVTPSLNDENWHFLRLVRDSNNLIRLFVDGNLESSITSSESYQNSSADITLGNTTSSPTNRFMNGCLLQVRIYCGGVLSDVDANIVFSYNPQPYTMKFGGIVWNIADSTKSKTAECKSFAKQFGDIQLSYNNLKTNNGILGTTTGIYNNMYIGQTADAIIKNFASNVLSGWSVKIIPSFGTTISKYIASGSLLTNLFYLLYTETGGTNGGNLTFFTTARKVMIIEKIKKDKTITPGALSFVGVQSGGRYDVTNDGQDDTAYINDVQITGAYITASYHETGSVSSSRTSTLAFAPITATVQAPSGKYLKMDNSSSPASPSFQIDVENKQIVFTGVADSTGYVIDYIYEDTTSGVWRNYDSTGITQNGRYSKQFNMIQMKDYFNMRNFAANVLARFGNKGSTSSLNRRVSINAPTLINSIRENYLVSITNGVKGAEDSTNFVNANYTIKQIKYQYPQGTTTIHLGDYLYDFYDILSSSGISSDQNTQSLTITKNTTNS